MREVGQTETAPLLSIEHATYTYEGEDHPVWEDLSLSFYSGKVHALYGPSGCGKSSVLYLLDGLIPHLYEGQLAGKVYWRGEDITGRLPHERCGHIGFVMQNPDSQFCAFTVEEELAFGLENMGVPTEDMHRRIRETLIEVGLSDYAAAGIDELSGGQKQKVAIAAALVLDPEVLILDEPTANLDPENRRMIFRLILAIARRGTTLILIEHNIREIIDEVDVLYTFDAEGRLRSAAPGREQQADLEAMNRMALQRVAPYLRTAPSDERILSLRQLSFGYPLTGGQRGGSAKLPVLQDCSFDIYRQEFLAIVGRNGAGKTTLMNLLFRTLEPDAGSITLYDRAYETWRKTELYRHIGLVFQNPESQFVKGTVREDLQFSLRNEQMSEDEKNERVQSMLRRFHLEACGDKSPYVLSQGQKRRLSVADMLMTGQDILFLDEPTFGQDFENRHELMRDMQRLIADGVTVVMITHDRELVAEYATRVLRLEDGQMTEVPIAEIKEGRA